MTRSLILLLTLLPSTVLAQVEKELEARSGWKQHETQRPRPPVTEPAPQDLPAPPPPGAIVLFDGEALDEWESVQGGPAPWRVVDGVMEAIPGAGYIQTRQEFGDVQLHVEWAAPTPPRGKGQDRGNSGVFLMGRYEVQVLDSYQADTYADGQAAAIYGQYPPLYNVARPPGEWQSYDIFFRRPRFGPAGELLERARITVVHNGVLVQNNEEILGPTSWLRSAPYQQHPDVGPLRLQDHDHPVRYRNVWALPMPDRPVAPVTYEADPPLRLSDAELDRYVGRYQPERGNNPMVVEREGPRLIFRTSPSGTPLGLIPVAPGEFAFETTGGRLVFETTGPRVTRLTFHMGGDERRAIRLP